MSVRCSARPCPKANPQLCCEHLHCYVKHTTEPQLTWAAHGMSPASLLLLCAVLPISRDFWGSSLTCPILYLHHWSHPYLIVWQSDSLPVAEEGCWCGCYLRCIPNCSQWFPSALFQDLNLHLLKGSITALKTNNNEKKNNKKHFRILIWLSTSRWSIAEQSSTVDPLGGCGGSSECATPKPCTDPCAPWSVGTRCLCSSAGIPQHNGSRTDLFQPPWAMHDSSWCCWAAGFRSKRCAVPLLQAVLGMCVCHWMSLSPRGASGTGTAVGSSGYPRSAAASPLLWAIPEEKERFCVAWIMLIDWLVFKTSKLRGLQVVWESKKKQEWSAGLIPVLMSFWWCRRGGRLHGMQGCSDAFSKPENRTGISVQTEMWLLKKAWNVQWGKGKAELRLWDDGG